MMLKKVINKEIIKVYNEIDKKIEDFISNTHNSIEYLQRISSLDNREGIDIYVDDKNNIVITPFSNLNSFCLYRFKNRWIKITHNSAVVINEGTIFLEKILVKVEGGMCTKFCRLDDPILNDKYILKNGKISRKYKETDRLNFTTAKSALFNYTGENPANVGYSNITKEIGYPYTYGVEIETSIGRVPIYILNNFNFKCVFDGSLRDEHGNYPVGGEYVSGVLRGDHGLQHIKKFLEVLEYFCSYDERCSVHVHIGSLKPYKSIVVALYLFCASIQHFMFEVFDSRRSSVYCRKIDNPYSILNVYDCKIETNVFINEFLKSLFRRCCGYELNHAVSGYDRRSNHPRGRHCGYDIESMRYRWVNFIPLIFDTAPSRTIEFRIFPPTFNYDEIVRYIKLAMLIVNYVENNAFSIIEDYLNCNNISSNLNDPNYNYVDFVNKNVKIIHDECYEVCNA